MRLVSLDIKALTAYKADKEMLQKARRPCVLIVRLKYKGRNYSFAVPLRSNIPPASPKDEYFALPPRSTTKPGHRHGIHYIKMFPVRESHVLLFHTENNMFESLIKSIIDKNERRIIKECQAYLTKYESGKRPPYATDIDMLIEIMNRMPTDP